MGDFLKNISESTKVFFLLVGYSVSMIWGISDFKHNVQTNTEYVKEHKSKDTEQAVAYAEIISSIKAMQEAQVRHNAVLDRIVRDHYNCQVQLKLLEERLKYNGKNK